MLVKDRLEAQANYSIGTLESACDALQDICRIPKSWHNHRKMHFLGNTVGFFAAILPRFMLDNPQLFILPEDETPETFMQEIYAAPKELRHVVMRERLMFLGQLNAKREELLSDLIRESCTGAFCDFVVTVFSRLEHMDFNIERYPYLMYRAVLDVLPSLLESDDQRAMGGNYTSPEISSLMAELACIRSGEKVYDGACGLSILISIAIAAMDVDLYAQDIDRYAAAISRFMMLLIGKKEARVENCDTLLRYDITDGPKSDLFLMHPPFNLSFGHDMMTNQPSEILEDGFDSNPRNDQWLFFRRAFQAIGENGRGVALVNISALDRDSRPYKSTRVEMIRKGYISAVIELPVGTVGYSTTKWSIVLFDKCGGHKDVYFLDLSRKALNDYFAKSGKGAYTFDETRIPEILKLVSDREEKPGISRNVSTREIEKLEYRLSAGSYLLESFPEDEDLVESVKILQERDLAKKDYIEFANNFEAAIEDYYDYRRAMENESGEQ